MRSGVNEIKRLLVITPLLLALMFGAVNLTTASVLPNLQTDFQGLEISESGMGSNKETVPHLMSREKDDGRFLFCKDLDDPNCIKAPEIYAPSHLPPCDVQLTINCIANVFAIDPSGNKLLGTFQKYIADAGPRDYPANQALNLPQGRGMGGVWNIPGAVFDGASTNYFVSVLVTAHLNKPADTKISTQKFNIGSFEAAITPVQEITGKFKPQFAQDSTNPSNDGSPNGGVGSGNNSEEYNPDCVVRGEGVCELPREFPANFRFGLTVILGNQINGWFHGRISKPIVVTKDLGDSKFQIQIEANPVVVPMIKERIPTSQISTDLRSFLTSGSTQSFAGGGTVGGYYVPGPTGENAFEMARLWMPLLKDKATKSNSFWKARNLNFGANDALRSCSINNPDLVGIVSTNALVYSAGPPEFNSTTQSIEYKLLSPHFQADGKETIGTYDLLLKSDVARCIYGFTNAPVRASISVVGESGESKVATESISEKDGWLIFSANGFTFSNPTVRVKLFQEAPVVTPTPTPTPSPSLTPSVTPSATPTPTPTPSSSPIISKPFVKKSTIVCVKGKTVKRVTAIKPICPKGYTKK